MGLAALAAEPPAGPSVGQDALLFSLPAVNEQVAIALVRNDHVSLGDLTGPMAPYPSSAVVLYFFARTEGGDGLAVLNRCFRKYSKEEVRFVAISLDSGNAADLSEWVGKQKITFPVLRDNHGIVASRYGVDSLPWTYIIDGDGRIRAIGAPAPDEIEAEIAAALGALLVE
jgi:peroxiredoxin